ncbi:MAG: hypothetical protein US61_C0038G0007 [Parcubacteria group bacterium GW2011_GWE2_37_8]|nr:MAG: hypothetical protein US61_C0038G0007 [Parcubacteria group bacterium GW2011_GWE2_37_8]
MLASIQRIFRNGAINFYRNGWLSTATISIMVLTLLVISSLMILSITTRVAVETLQNKIDITVYFSKDATEDKISEVTSELNNLGIVKNVEYISKEDALSKFKERHKDNSLLLQSLSELDDNPLPSSVNIKAKDPSNFANIVSFLESGSAKDMIDKINYYENQTMINRLTRFISTTRQLGLALIIMFSTVAFLVSFNTVRVAIYTAREEISIMKLVGASNWFIRGPFLAEGFLYGLIASIVTVAIFYPVLSFASPYINAFLPKADIYNYFKENFFQFFGIISAIGVGIGVISSLIAIRKHLKN